MKVCYSLFVCLACCWTNDNSCFILQCYALNRATDCEKSFVLLLLMKCFYDWWGGRMVLTKLFLVGKSLTFCNYQRLSKTFVLQNINTKDRLQCRLLKAGMTCIFLRSGITDPIQDAAQYQQHSPIHQPRHPLLFLTSWSRATMSPALALISSIWQ